MPQRRSQSRGGPQRASRADKVARRAVAALLARDQSLVLAVSGGRDSMCLLQAFGEQGRAARRVTVATFDHGTGSHATEAVSLVMRQARSFGFQVVSARAFRTVPSEAEWRRARWEFLRSVARGRDAIIVTAHTLDDHLETLVMRLLRGTGGRGLAGLRAPPGKTPPLVIERPFLELSRAELASWAREHGVAWSQDPSNDDLRFFRNRVRRDVLPALHEADRALLPALDQLSRELARIRSRLRGIAGRYVLANSPGLMDVSPTILEAEEASRRILWAELLESVGVVLDRRGYARLGQLSSATASGTMVPTSGGVAVTRMRDRLVVHPTASHAWGSVKLRRDRASRAGDWLFRWATSADGKSTGSPWFSRISAPDPLVVRRWTAGDRWCGPGARAPRLVARYLAEAGIPPALRKGWPVVEQNGEIVWVPGVRRASAAPAPSGRPTALLCCEPDHR